MLTIREITDKLHYIKIQNVSQEVKHWKGAWVGDDICNTERTKGSYSESIKSINKSIRKIQSTQKRNGQELK